MRISFYCLLFFSLVVRAEDARQNLPETYDKSDVSENYKKASVKNPFLPEQSSQPDFSKVKGESLAVPQYGNRIELTQPLTEGEKLNSVGVEPIGTNPQRAEYLEHSNEGILSAIRGRGARSFSFGFYYDTYDYTNSSGTEDFERTFRTQGSSDPGIIFNLAFHRFFVRKALRIGWGASLGAGYNQGTAFFKNSTTQSSAEFNLWTIPVDLSLLIESSAEGLMRFGFEFGPSMMGIAQSRNDFEDDDSRKRLYQVSPGAFAKAKLGLSLSRWMPKNALGLYHQFKVTNYLVNFEVRGHYYGNFKTESIEVSGVSAGIGFSFDYF